MTLAAPPSPPSSASLRRCASWAVPLLATGFLGACAVTPNVGTDVAATGMPNPELALRDSLRQVDAAMSELGTTRGVPPPDTAAGPILPGELQKPVTFSYQGDLDAGVRKVATSLGYQTVVEPPPAGSPPLDVAVAAASMSAYQALQALGDAAGTRATVVVNPYLRQVKVVHHA